MISALIKILFNENNVDNNKTRISLYMHLIMIINNKLIKSNILELKGPKVKIMNSDESELTYKALSHF